MLLSPEKPNSDNVLAFLMAGAKPTRRHRVRRGGFGGVVEQGRVSTGRPWNTREPSLNQGPKPEKGWHRPTTSRAAEAGDGRRCDQSPHHQPCIAAARPQPKRRAEESGSLSAPIVPMERRRTGNGRNRSVGKGKFRPALRDGRASVCRNPCVETRAQPTEEMSDIVTPLRHWIANLEAKPATEEPDA